VDEKELAKRIESLTGQELFAFYYGHEDLVDIMDSSTYNQAEALIDRNWFVYAYIEAIKKLYNLKEK